MKLKAGVKKDGTLTALDFTVLGTGGAYPAGGTSLVDWLVRDLYTLSECPDTDDRCLYQRRALPAFRAPGHPQGAWALEQMMDALAEAIEMDPVELRLKNIPSVQSGAGGKSPYTTTGLKECLEEGAKAFGWEEARKKMPEVKQDGHIRRGVGMASCLWFVGGGGPTFDRDRQALFRRERQSEHGRERYRHRDQDRDGHGRRRRAGRADRRRSRSNMPIPAPPSMRRRAAAARPCPRSRRLSGRLPSRSSSSSWRWRAEELKVDASDLILREARLIGRSDPSKKIKISDVSGLKEARGASRRGLPRTEPGEQGGQSLCRPVLRGGGDTRTGEVKILRFPCGP